MSETKQFRIIRLREEGISFGDMVNGVNWNCFRMFSSMVSRMLIGQLWVDWGYLSLEVGFLKTGSLEPVVWWCRKTNITIYWTVISFCKTRTEFGTEFNRVHQWEQILFENTKSKGEKWWKAGCPVSHKTALHCECYGTVWDVCDLLAMANNSRSHLVFIRPCATATFAFLFGNDG